MYSNPNHDLLLNLTKYMLCLNLTKHFTTLNMWQQKSINYSKYLTFVTFTPFIHWWHAGRDLLIGSNEVLCIQSVPQYFVANDRPMEQPSGAIWNSVSKERPSDRDGLRYLQSQPHHLFCRLCMRMFWTMLKQFKFFLLLWSFLLGVCVAVL